MKLRYLTYFFCVVFMITEFSLCAQGRGMKPPHPPQGGRPPIYPELPIEGGLSYLLIGGILIGVYHIKRKKPSN